jgi:muconolactone D-isomerase
VLFLLNIRTQLPGEWSPEQRADMLQREFTAGVKLMEQRVILRMLRVVGQLANFSVWQTATLEDLHAVLQSLPLFAFMTITVIPVIKHPVEEAYELEHGPIEAFVS